MARSSLLPAPAAASYSQFILREFGWIDDAKGIDIDGVRIGTGYSQI